MPRKASKKAGYTQAQKLAYYKAKASRQYSGHGKYKAPRSREAGANIGRTLGSSVSYLPGGSVLAPAASWLGDKLGGYLGNKLGSYMGWGEYTVNRNSLTVPEGNSPASMHSSGMTTRICHREYVADILSSGTAGAFKLDSYKIQPGSPEMFPWLSDIAINYQKYKLLGAIVEFKSGSGDAITGTNTALGEVIISTNYNNADPNFTSRNQMENTQYCSSAKPSVSFVHIIECDPAMQAQEALYTSASTSPITGLSPNDINWANVQVATIGCQGTNVNLGSLYITYEVELIQPIEYTAIRRPLTDQFDCNVFTSALPLNGATAYAQNSIGGSVSGSVYSFPSFIKEGTFAVMNYYQGTVAAAFAAPAITIANGVTSTVWNGAISGISAPNAGVSSTRCMTILYMRVTGSPCTLTYGGGGTLPHTNPVSLFQIQMMDGSFSPLVMPTPTTMKICKEPLHSRETIRDEYHEALANCEDAGESEIIERLKRKLAELENKSPALAYQVDRLNRQ